MGARCWLGASWVLAGCLVLGASWVLAGWLLGAWCVVLAVCWLGASRVLAG